MSRDCPSRSALRLGLQPLRPALATTTSADFSLPVIPVGLWLRRNFVFSHKARSPQVRTQSFAAQSPHLRRLDLDHKSFAIICPLALPGAASYAFRVPRLAVSLHASSPRSVTLAQLRFTSLTVVSSREDLHLQDRAHAGRTNEKRRPKSPFALKQRRLIQQPPRRSPHRSAPAARLPVPRPPASRWPCARRRPSLPWPCGRRGKPCRCPRGSGDRR